MTDTYKNITVLVICYKQQDVIKRALDSVLCQREYGLNKIVVCDDCSPDKTWDVLQDYKSRYPEYFEIHRNEHNLGIYQNMEKLVSLRGESDLFVNLSGDDAFENGFFKAVQDYIRTNTVDFSVPIGIYADYKVIYPNGNQTICRQNIVEDKSLNRFSLYIRYKLCGRSMMINDLVLQKQKPTIFDKGLNLAESFFDCQKHLIVEKGYYVPVVGDIYYGGIGISMKLADTDYYSTQAMVKWQYYLDNLITKKEDVLLARAEIMKCQFILSPSIKGYFKCLRTYLVSGYPHKPTFNEVKNFTLLMKHRVFKKYEKYWLLWAPIKLLYRL